MNNYTNFDRYLSQLQQDIYPQKQDMAHTAWALDSLAMIPPDVEVILDVGCGEGFLKEPIEAQERVWNGLTLGKRDWEVGRKKGRSGLYHGDFTFTNFQDGMFDMVYARHALEHSPFPILTLMEWHRIAAKYLLLIAPAPEFWGYIGQNHYAVGNEDQVWWWLRRSGWKIFRRKYLRTDDARFLVTYRPEEEDRDTVEHPGAPMIVEYRYLCKKVEPVAT